MKLFKTLKKLFAKNYSDYKVICPVCEYIQPPEQLSYNNIALCSNCGVLYSISFATKVSNFSNSKKENLSDAQKRVRERINRLKKGNKT